MRKIIAIFYFSLVWQASTAQKNFNISIIYKKIDSILLVKQYFTSDIASNKSVFDYNFLNGKIRTKGKQKCKLYYNKKGIVKKIEWVDFTINKTMLNICFYPVKISKDFTFYLIEINNQKKGSSIMNRGFILHSIKDNKLFHLSFQNEIMFGIKANNHIEGISLLDSNLYARKFVRTLPMSPYLVESNGYLLYDQNNYITFHSNAKNLSVKIDDNLYNLNKLFDFNKDLKTVKLNHYDKTKLTPNPYFHPYFLYGFSLLGYERYD